MPHVRMTSRRALGEWLGWRLNHLPLLRQMGLVLPALLCLVGVLAGLGLL